MSEEKEGWVEQKKMAAGCQLHRPDACPSCVHCTAMFRAILMLQWWESKQEVVRERVEKSFEWHEADLHKRFYGMELPKTHEEYAKLNEEYLRRQKEKRYFLNRNDFPS